MLKRLWYAGLLAIGLGNLLPASAQAPQTPYGWTRLVNAAWSEERGPTGGQCIDVPGASRQVGTVVAMFRCHNVDNQFFRLMDGSFTSSRIAVYAGGDERCLGHQAPAGKLIIVNCPTAPRWRTTSAGEIATEDLKYCVRIPDDGRPELVGNCNPFAPEPRAVFGSNWHMASLGSPFGNIISVVNQAFYKCIDVRGAATAPGSSLIYYPCTGAPNQTVQVRGTTQQVFFLVYAGREMLCLSNVLDRGNPRSTQAVPCNRTDPRQAWNFRTGAFPTPGLRLQNAKTQRCLDAFVYSGDVGAWETCHADRNQAWLFLET